MCTCLVVVCCHLHPYPLPLTTTPFIPTSLAPDRHHRCNSSSSTTTTLTNTTHRAPPCNSSSRLAILCNKRNSSRWALPLLCRLQEACPHPLPASQQVAYLLHTSVYA